MTSWGAQCGCGKQHRRPASRSLHKSPSNAAFTKVFYVGLTPSANLLQRTDTDRSTAPWNSMSNEKREVNSLSFKAMIQDEIVTIYEFISNMQHHRVNRFKSTSDRWIQMMMKNHTSPNGKLLPIMEVGGMKEFYQWLKNCGDTFNQGSTRGCPNNWRCRKFQAKLPVRQYQGRNFQGG